MILSLSKLPAVGADTVVCLNADSRKSEDIAFVHYVGQYWSLSFSFSHLWQVDGFLFHVCPICCRVLHLQGRWRSMWRIVGAIFRQWSMSPALSWSVVQSRELPSSFGNHVCILSEAQYRLLVYSPSHFLLMFWLIQIRPHRFFDGHGDCLIGPCFVMASWYMVAFIIRPVITVVCLLLWVEALLGFSRISFTI